MMPPIAPVMPPNVVLAVSVLADGDDLDRKAEAGA